MPFSDYSLEDELPTVNVNAGTIRGYYKRSYENRVFSAFEGIPYAKPPIGQLRFAEPVPVEPWSGILNATVLYECANPLNIKSADKEEDCLYLNVYVPRKKPIPNENLDVIVFIYGGFFMMGNTSIYGPEFLMDANVIYVSMNYRVGPFGFLSTGDDAVKGNNGLKDQVLALKWVQSNIRYFGGNQRSVTLSGESSGGSSVHLHYFSNLSKGLFHRGISHSGTALASWSLITDPLKNAKKLSRAVGCNNSSTRAMVECMRVVPATVICKYVPVTFTSVGFPANSFGPVVEKVSKSAFLEDSAHSFLQRGMVYNVPWMSTTCSSDGIVLLYKNLQTFNEHWLQDMPDILGYENTSETEKKNISNRIVDFYTAESPIPASVIVNAVDDEEFNIPWEESVLMQAKVSKSPIYAYYYDYECNADCMAYDREMQHVQDARLIYYDELLQKPKSEGGLSKDDEWMKTFLVGIVTSFAHDGVPKPVKFKPVTHASGWRYLHIKDKNNIRMEYDKHLETIEFWDDILSDVRNQTENL
ncbi:hypothetical protein RI129_008302 [Pyrocoelia pectoralis]|uniref:Carboxylic ester hydrolase n=1 Tax=Pyrocoelia pectoralis TaxID=417401 RepID=A0AAN7V542_9COLE